MHIMCCEKGIFFLISTQTLVRNNMYWISFSKYDTYIDYMEYTQLKNIMLPVVHMIKDWAELIFHSYFLSNPL